jgi:hypothetical protein
MIILLGFPKSGTTSFQKLFELLNIESYHQKYHKIIIAKKIKYNIINKKPLLFGFKPNIALTQIDYCFSEFGFWPQITHYQRLYEENKHYIFILNKRNPYDLLKSFKKWNNYDKRIININPELFININGDSDDERLINLFKKHYEDVESFFNSLSDAKFIVYDINNDTIEKLRKYIDIKDITVMPHENKNNLN